MRLYAMPDTALVEHVEDNSGVVGQPWATRKHALNAVIGGVTLVNQAKRLVVVPNWQKNRDLSSYTHTYGSHMTSFFAQEFSWKNKYLKTLTS